jgi:hypothetical protein
LPQGATLALINNVMTSGFLKDIGQNSVHLRTTVPEVSVLLHAACASVYSDVLGCNLRCVHSWESRKKAPRLGNSVLSGSESHFKRRF